MLAENTNTQGVTSYTRLFLMALVLPLLFIAGVQLFVLSEQTETYFAWTFASPISAAFLGGGYWAAMLHAYRGVNARSWAFVRSSWLASITATTLLAITTYLHIDKFHLGSPLFITRFVTWVWIAIYIFTPPALTIIGIMQTRISDPNSKGQDPLPIWMKAGFGLLAAFALLSGLGLFITPANMTATWPWAVTPLAARTVGSWMAAFGVACATLLYENDFRHGNGTCSSLFAFCILQLIVFARYTSAIDWSKPLAIGYLLFLFLGLIVCGSNLFANRKLST